MKRALSCVVLAGTLVPGAASAQDGADALTQAVASIEVRLDRRRAEAGRLERKMTPPIRRALNAWAEAAHGLGMSIVIPKEAPALVIGPCDEDVLRDAAGWIDETWALFAQLRPADERPERAMVAFLLDREGYASQAWPALLDELVARRMLASEARDPLARDVTGLTLRASRVFVQPTFDIAGDAAAGDDEFRLGNEVAHKATWCLLRERFGQVPPMLRWGLGYVAEQRLFESIYQFGRVGFVSVEEHFGWPRRAHDSLKTRDDDASFARLALQDDSAGSSNASQRIVWGVLDYMLHEEPEALATMLAGLAALQEEATPYGSRPDYVGERERARAILETHLDGLDRRDLRRHVRRID